jgi:hypothetical protein
MINEVIAQLKLEHILLIKTNATRDAIVHGQERRLTMAYYREEGVALLQLELEFFGERILFGLFREQRER